MQEFTTLLKLPIGKLLSEGNWESHVHGLGDDFVYKEIKSPESIDKTTENYENRVILQRFWNTDIHFENMKKDHEVFLGVVGDHIPKTAIGKCDSLLSEKKDVIVMVQKKVHGVLLKDTDGEVGNIVTELAQKVKALCDDVFRAPADFHKGNMMVTSSEEVMFFDTGTPSDWYYFLNVSNMESVLNLSHLEAEGFVEFMKPIHENHWKKLFEFANM